MQKKYSESTHTHSTMLCTSHKQFTENISLQGKKKTEEKKKTHFNHQAVIDSLVRITKHTPTWYQIAWKDMYFKLSKRNLYYTLILPHYEQITPVDHLKNTVCFDEN